MKRSEIIGIIANYFYECNVESEDCNELANQLLNDLEKQGMLPPLASNEFHEKWAQEMGFKSMRDYQLDTGQEEEFHEWESEDAE